MFHAFTIGDVLDGPFIEQKRPRLIKHRSNTFRDPQHRSISATHLRFKGGHGLEMAHVDRKFIPPIGFDVDLAIDRAHFFN